MNSDWKARQLWYTFQKQDHKFETEWEAKAWKRLVSVLNRSVFGPLPDVDEVLNINTRVIHQLEKTVNKPLNHSVPDKRKLTLITQFYQTGNSSRDTELIDSINRNIENLLIEKIVIFVNSKDIKKLKSSIQDKNIITVIHKKPMLTYDDIFSWCEKEKLDGIYLLANTDCYFDESVKYSKLLDFKEPVLYTMTRYENYYSDELTLGRDMFVGKQSECMFDREFTLDTDAYNKLPYLEPWSADAFIFDNKLISKIKASKINADIKMGTESCEVELQYNLHKTNTRLRNIGFHGHIKCIHNHKTNYRRKENWPGVPICDKLPGIFDPTSKTRTIDNSIHGCYRLQSKSNWMDKDAYWHGYTKFVVPDLNLVLVPPVKATEHKQTTSTVYTEDICLLYMGTRREYRESNEMVGSINCFLTNLDSKHKVDLFICLDKKPDDIKPLLKFEQHKNINKVIVKWFDIPDKENIYYRPWLASEENPPPEKIPVLGLSTGPNTLFYSTCDYMLQQKCKYYLMLEADTVPLRKNWLDYCIKQTKQQYDWVISSSVYKGSDENNLDQWHSDHPYLNGVGIYKNNKQLQKLLAGSKQLIIDFVEQNRFQQFINYDTAIGHYIRCYEPWNGKLVHNADYIINMSPAYDKDVKLSTVLEKFPKGCILHNKRTHYNIKL